MSAHATARYADGSGGDAEIARVHELLVSVAQFELRRRRTPAAHVHELAREAADAALVDLRTRLDDYRGQTSFTTWAAKFAIVAAAVSSRRREWEDRELPRSSAHDALPVEIDALPADQRRVLIALALHGVPIDVLAERDGTTRNALYATLQEARRTLRARLATTRLD